MGAQHQERIGQQQVEIRSLLDRQRVRVTGGIRNQSLQRLPMIIIRLQTVVRCLLDFNQHRRPDARIRPGQTVVSLLVKSRQGKFRNQRLTTGSHRIARLHGLHPLSDNLVGRHRLADEQACQQRDQTPESDSFQSAPELRHSAASCINGVTTGISI